MTRIVYHWFRGVQLYVIRSKLILYYRNTTWCIRNAYFLFFKFEFLMKWETAVILVKSAPVLSTRRTRLCDTLSWPFCLSLNVSNHWSVWCLVTQICIKTWEIRSWLAACLAIGRTIASFTWFSDTSTWHITTIAGIIIRVLNMFLTHCSLRKWNFANVRQIGILGWEIIKLREPFDYPTSDICRKRQTCLTFIRKDCHCGQVM